MDKDVLHEGVLFALQEPKYVANPYPLYQRLRSEAPVYWDFVSSAWFVTRYADVRTGLVDPRLGHKKLSVRCESASARSSKKPLTAGAAS